MNEQVRNQLSAMLDDELEGRECEMLVARLGKDPDLRSTWERYALIGDCMRGRLLATVSGGFSGRVVAQASAPGAGSVSAGSSGKWRPAAGVAIAASVAMVALFALRSPGPGSPEFDTSAIASTTENGYTVPVIKMSEQASAAMRERLNLYQVSHSEFAGPIQRRALLTQMAGETDASPDGDAGPEGQ